MKFESSTNDKGKAFDVGYYKVTSANVSTNKKNFGYGKFHVLLRKENGVWKILMDADAGEKIDETIFLTGKPMQ